MGFNSAFKVLTLPALQLRFLWMCLIDQNIYNKAL